MATRSFIAREMDSGYEGVYCHWDGYPEHNGAVLQAYYSDPDKLAYLLSFGDISSLGPEIGSDHSFEDRPEGETTFYGRDRGESGSHTKPRRISQLPEILDTAAVMDCEFVYVFTHKRWFYFERDPRFCGCDDSSAFSEPKLLQQKVEPAE